MLGLVVRHRDERPDQRLARPEKRRDGDLVARLVAAGENRGQIELAVGRLIAARGRSGHREPRQKAGALRVHRDRKSTRLNSSHVSISYAVFCLKKKKHKKYASSICAT